jgi:hypothetical protein
MPPEALPRDVPQIDSNRSILQCEKIQEAAADRCVSGAQRSLRKHSDLKRTRFCQLLFALQFQIGPQRSVGNRRHEFFEGGFRHRRGSVLTPM